RAATGYPARVNASAQAPGNRPPRRKWSRCSPRKRNPSRSITRRDGMFSEAQASSLSPHWEAEAAGVAVARWESSLIEQARRTTDHMEVSSLSDRTEAVLLAEWI